uniref:Uncharacterized protein n=1 Tax=Pyxicephalus adspersus TaxID=30357 RepID=A0AAV2ZSW4_PYXAD|nr:TPA: hypothetical protein GDO54_004045 [Pyxicephalus adspersus]
MSAHNKVEGSRFVNSLLNNSSFTLQLPFCLSVHIFRKIIWGRIGRFLQYINPLLAEDDILEADQTEGALYGASLFPHKPHR